MGEWEKKEKKAVRERTAQTEAAGSTHVLAQG